MSGATSPVEIKVWPEGAPKENGLSSADMRSDGDFLIGVSEAELLVYPAENPNGTAIMMCPGGGYYGLAMGHEGKDMAPWLNDMGITYAILKYRMPNGHHEVPLSDAEQAMRILRERSPEWGINPNSIGVMGASAGGHLASTLATHYSSNATRPDFQILFYPVVSMDESITHEGSRVNLIGQNPSQELVTLFSNEEQVTPDTPKAFIMDSSDDDLVPIYNSLRYYTSLKKNNVSAALHVYPTGGHGWGFSDSFNYKPAWTAELETWLRNEVLPAR